MLVGVLFVILVCSHIFSTCSSSKQWTQRNLVCGLKFHSWNSMLISWCEIELRSWHSFFLREGPYRDPPHLYDSCFYESHRNVMALKLYCSAMLGWSWLTYSDAFWGSGHKHVLSVFMCFMCPTAAGVQIQLEPQLVGSVGLFNCRRWDDVFFQLAFSELFGPFFNVFWVFLKSPSI